MDDIAAQFIGLFEIVVSLPKQPSLHERIESPPRPRVDLVRHFSKFIDGSHAHSLMDRARGRFEADQLGRADIAFRRLEPHPDSAPVGRVRLVETQGAKLVAPESYYLRPRVNSGNF